MSHSIEPLEARRLFTNSFTILPYTPVTGSFGATPLDTALSVVQVQTILAQAASPAKSTQAIAVVDREGEVLGLYGGAGLQNQPMDIQQEIIADAEARARTAAFFSSTGEAFTTRTARFIIQDHFPAPVFNTPGGPLYGVEFSSLINSDILLPSQTPAISGDPGGVPLYIGGVPVGGIGVAGDFHDFAARSDLTNLDAYVTKSAPPGKLKFYNGHEESDFDEAVALAGAQNFMAAPGIRANQIFVNGLRFPFTSEPAAGGPPGLSLDQLIASHAGQLLTYPNAQGTTPTSALIPGESELQDAAVDGIPGLLRQESNAGLTTPQPANVPIVNGAMTEGQQLTVSDVQTIMENAVAQAVHTRALIRKPNGRNAVVQVAVTDTMGTVLGVFRMGDATNFSYDVAVQKARTAMYFSDDTHAFSSRAVGFLSQLFFPPGIPGVQGPLYHLQDDLDSAPSTLNLNVVKNTPLKNGITIFPGGFPLYKNGVLVGGVGISGDGVDQDDIISYAATAGFRNAGKIHSDELNATDAGNFLVSRVNALNQEAGINFDTSNFVRDLQNSKVRLPYAKFPRNPII